MEHHISSIDKLAWLPTLNDLEKLHPKVKGVDSHNGIGPGGVIDDLLTWVIELLLYYNETGDVLEQHWAIGVEGTAKRTLQYERLFVTNALALLPLVPRTLQRGMLITSKPDRMHIVFEYIPAAGEMSIPNALMKLTVDQFIRPKKIRRDNSSMNPHREPTP